MVNQPPHVSALARGVARGKPGKMSEHVFEPGRLRLARDLAGQSQAEVAQRLDITPSALSQFESGASRPSAETQKRLSSLLGVSAAFFELPLIDRHDGFSRALRRTSVADRRRARAIAHVAHDLATHGVASSQLPPMAVPRFPITSVAAERDEAERIAAEVRRAWGSLRVRSPILSRFLGPMGWSSCDCPSTPRTWTHSPPVRRPACRGPGIGQERPGEVPVRRGA